MATLVLMTVTLANAASWRINPNPAAKAPYKTVADAMADNKVKAGDTLMLDPGYHGAFSLSKKNMTLIGTGYMLDQNKGWAESMVSSTNNVYLSEGSKIEGVASIGSISASKDCIISRCKANEINCNSSNVLIEQSLTYFARLSQYSIVRNNIIIGWVNGAEATTIENNVIVPSGNRQAIQGCTNSTIRNNIVLNTYSGYDNNDIPYNAYVIDFNTDNNNTITNNVFSTPAEYANKNYSSNYYVGATIESVFVNEGTEDARYMLRDDSPAKGVASHGGDCGAFGGSTPYVLSGIPRYLPHITEAKIPNRPTDGKITIKIKIETQDE